MTCEADKLRWCAALVAFDLDDRAPLATLVAAEAVPEALRPVIAAIVAGERTPNARAAARSKVPPAERFMIGATLAALLDTIQGMRHPEVTGPYADARGIEPADAMRRLNEYGERAYTLAADRLNVSRETVENLVREFREKLKNWPNV